LDDDNLSTDVKNETNRILKREFQTDDVLVVKQLTKKFGSIKNKQGVVAVDQITFGIKKREVSYPSSYI